jgi:hypothetical protein
MFGTTPMHTRLALVVAVVAAAGALLIPAASATPFITDTLAPGGTPATSSPFITDTLAPGGGAGGFVSVPAGNGFSWADAGIGGLVACGLMLLALTGRQLDRKRRGQLAF